MTTANGFQPLPIVVNFSVEFRNPHMTIEDNFKNVFEWTHF